ncbi:tape measure protein, partial [Bilophila wadsworthia]
MDASLQMDRLNKAYATITGSSSAAQNQLDYMYDVTQRLGLQFQGTAEAAKGFFAAGKDSALKDHLNGIFESVSMAGSALALSKDQMDGVFLALGQMISKGKVQAEELRGQLGERLPGAFDMAAKAMGVTTAKLDDMLKKGQVTAEEMLPKLAKVLHDDFAVAAAEASQGLQGQLNRLSTEWTRFQASLLNGDAAAKVMKQLASGMKVLADHGAEIASIVGKGIQWAVWTAGVHALIKAYSGLRAAVTAAKAALVAFNVSSVAANVSSVAAAVGSLSGLLGPAGLAAAAGAAIVAFTSLSSSTQSADDIFRKHQATIDDYKEKMGKATDAVKTFSEEQEKAYRRSLEQQRDSMKTDIAAAVGDVNSAVSGVQTFSLDNLYSSKAAALIQARKEVEELGRELAKLGQNVTQDNLNAYAEKVWAIDERMRGAGLATKEWNDMITNLVGEGDSFVLKMAAMIAKSLEIEGTLEQLRQTTANAKGELATGWSIGLEGVDAALDKLDTRIRTAQAKISNVKGMSDAAGTFKDFSVDQLEVLKKALDTGGRGALIKTLGEQYHVAAGQIQEVSGAMTKYFGRLKVTTEAEEKAAKIEEERRKKHSGKASAIEQTSTKLETLRKEVAALEEANIPAAKSFDQVVAKLELERKNAVATAEETAKLSVQRKQATATQATEQKALEIRKAELVYTQKLREAEAKRDDDLKKNADLRLDFEKRYADMVGLSSEAVSKSISKQAEEYRKAIEAGENAAEELVRLEEWKRDQIQRASREAMDGAQVALRDYQVEASNQAKSMNDAFRGLFSGMDSGWKSAWEQMIETSRVSLSSFRSVFVSFLADLMHMAITRPITVQIAGVVSGMLGTGGVAYAAGGSGGVGGIGNLSGLSNFMPGSWFSGIGNTINDTMAGWFPGTFAMSGAAGTVMTPVVGAADIAGLKAAEAAMLGGNAGGGMAASGGTFLSTVSPYLMAGGLGSLGYTMLGGALGLPQSKYSGLTAGLGGAAGWGLGSLAAGSFASIGATMGSVVPVVGTIIGALAGGALGSLFGQERKTHPSVYGHMMGQGYTTDTQAYIDAFMNQATYDRAGKTEASAYAQVIGEAASQTAGNILNLAAMLPDEYKKSVEDQLESATWSAGRGFSGASWNLQNWKEGMAEERIQEAVDDMFEQMGYGANKAFAEAGIGDLFTTFDLSTEEGFKKAQTAISAISSITTAIDEIKSPTSEAERQAGAFVTQMKALGDAVKASGLNAAYADKMIGEYRTAYVDKYVETLEEMFNPLSQIEQQAKNYKTTIDGYVAALTTMGASEAQLAQVRGYAQDAIDNITGSLDAAFFPLSEVETQTKATMESLLAYKSALETLGASAEELTRIDAAWGKMQADLLDKARAYVSTTPQIVSQAAAMNAEFDALRKAMELAGNATADLTELEQTRAQAVAALQAQYAESFRQTYAQRYATLTGDTNGLANLQQQASFASELAEIEKTWGKDSEQYRQMQALHDAEAAKQRLEQAQAAYDALQAQLEKQQAELKQLEQQAVQLQIEEIQKLQTASKERIAALE